MRKLFLFLNFFIILFLSACDIDPKLEISEENQEEIIEITLDNYSEYFYKNTTIENIGSLVIPQIYTDTYNGAIDRSLYIMLK